MQGRDGTGAVYLAIDERFGRHIVVKHLPPTLLESARLRRQLRRGASTLARLSHPSIVKVLDLVEAEDGDWIVMEPVDGPSAEDLMGEAHKL